MLRGKIKQKLEDFIVEEIPPPRLKVKEGKYTVFWIEKVNWDTNRALKEIAKRLHVSVKRFSIAGLKDKYAVTRQRACVRGVDQKELEKVRIKGIRLYAFSKSDKRIKMGELAGNKFTVIVRDLAYSEGEIKSYLLKKFSELKKGIPNYFGPQRFGEVRKITHLVGLALLKNDFELACKLYLAKPFKTEPKDAKLARTNLWKKWGDKVAYLEALKTFPKRLKNERSMLDYLVRYPIDFHGALRRLPLRIRKLFINAVQAYIWNSALKGSKLKDSRKLPLIGYDTKLDLSDPIQKKMYKIMKRLGISQKNFRMHSAPELATSGAMRDTLLVPRKLKLLSISEDELNPDKLKVKLSFELPAGAYATIVLNKLFKL